jgi:drug/metabolite transporter (DMT)-like permease
VSPSTGVVFRCLFGLPVLVAVAVLEQRRYGPLPTATVRLAAAAGVFFAGDLLFWHHAIEAVGAGLATVLGNLQVLVVGLVAWLVLRERPSRAIFAALPVVLVGVALISGLGGGAYGKIRSSASRSAWARRAATPATCSSSGAAGGISDARRGPWRSLPPRRR